MRRRRPTARASAGASADVRAVLDAFRRIVQALRVAGHHGQRTAGLTVAQLFALQQIAAHPGVSVNDLAVLTYTHQSSVSVVIRRLAARRLIVKVAPPHDRRRQHLEVTAAGRRLVRRVPGAVQQRLIAAVGELPAAQRGALAAALTAIARRVAPGEAAAPMLFEDEARRSYDGRHTAGRRNR